MAGDFWSKCVSHKPVIEHNFKTIYSTMATLGTKKGEADSNKMVYLGYSVICIVNIFWEN